MDRKPESVSMQFPDNALLPMLYGEDDKNLLKIEKSFGVVATSRGNMLALSGEPGAVQMSRDILQGLYSKLESGMEVTPAQVDAAIRMMNPKAVPERKGAGRAHRRRTQASARAVQYGSRY